MRHQGVSIIGNSIISSVPNFHRRFSWLHSRNGKKSTSSSTQRKLLFSKPVLPVFIVANPQLSANESRIFMMLISSADKLRMILKSNPKIARFQFMGLAIVSSDIMDTVTEKSIKEVKMYEGRKNASRFNSGRI